jgi:16S rRNA (guanine(966)-N(2))-methyltransferase RsmD
MMIRIIAGKYKGNLIEVPRGVRATGNKVREALFDILAGKIAGASVLDLFAGSGSLGIEALSRGAKSATFIEKSKRCAEVIKKNIFIRLKGPGPSKQSLKEAVTILVADAIRAPERLYKQNKIFDLIFLDPPYRRGMVKISLKSISSYDILRPNSLVVAEHSRDNVLPEEIGSLYLIRKRLYGDTALSIYRMRPNLWNNENKSDLSRQF